MDHITWFVSFAPFDNPKYAVVVMVESGSSGGGTCAPKAKEIYLAIQKMEQARLKKMAGP
jgi:penicillin-binding protein 2